MVNERSAPEIRFDGFANEWVQKTINDYGYFYYGKSAPKWSVKPDAPTPCVRYGELYTKFDGLVDTVYSYTNIAREKLKFRTGHEVLVPRVGEEPLDFARCSWLSLPNIAIGEMISVYNTEQNPLFIALYFSAMMRNAFADKVEGGNVSNLYFNRLLDLEVSFPSIPEQEHIAVFFRFLNDTIALKKQQYEQTVNIKKAMLEKMFPQKGADVPEIRFDGFNGAWEECDLGYISNVSTGPFGSTLHAKDYVSDGTPIITTEHFKTGSLLERKNGIPQVSDEDLKRLRSYVLREGDVVFSRVGSVDISALVTNIQVGWLFSGRVLRVRTNESINSQYLNYELSTERVKKDVIMRAVGQTMPSINTEILQKTKVFLPCDLDEQNAIGCFLHNLDLSIKSQSDEITIMQNIKKACLSKMFV